MPNERLRAALLEHGLTPSSAGRADRRGLTRPSSGGSRSGRVPYRRHRYAVAARLGGGRGVPVARCAVAGAGHGGLQQRGPGDLPAPIRCPATRSGSGCSPRPNRRSGSSSTPGSSWPRKRPCRRSSPPRPEPGCGCGSCSVTRTARRWPSGAPTRASARAWPPGYATHWCCTGRCAPPSGAEFRFHRTTLYNSIFRGDDQLLVNTHVYGLAGAYAPAWHLRKVAGGEIVSTYLDSFERVWDSRGPGPGVMRRWQAGSTTTTTRTPRRRTAWSPRRTRSWSTTRARSC